MSDEQPDIIPQGTLVPFGKTIKIQASHRLPHLDQGLAKAYEAFDEREKSKKFIAMVCGVECLPRTESESTYSKLADPSFLRLMGSGILQWPPKNEQKFVLLYQADIGQCLVKRGEFSHSSWRHPDVVAHFVQPMARMLKEMADKGFCHGAIRPDNIFYSAFDRNSAVVLGDCLSTFTHSSQPSVMLPIDRALADPMGRGEGVPSDDVYAFGVSLALFLRRGNEFAGLSDDDIVRRKMELGSYTAIIGAERFQASFLELLRGVLHDDPVLRWSVDDIFSWMDGSRLTPAPTAKRKKANRPITFMGKKYLYADLLALDLFQNPNELSELVVSEELGRWIEKSLTDKHMYEAYENTLTRIGGASEDKDSLVTHLRMVLNPALPIYYKKRRFTYDGLGALMAVAAYEDKDLSVFKEAIMLSLPEFAVGMKGLPVIEITAISKLYDRCRTAMRHKKKGMGIEKCIHLLCKSAPCLSPKLKGYFVYDYKSALVTYEVLAGQKGQSALFMDSKAIAFFSVFCPALMERCLADFNAAEKDSQIFGNLKFLSILQSRCKGMLVPKIGAVFQDSLSGVYKVFKNKKLRAQVEVAVRAAAQEGSLVKMVSFLEDDNTRIKDNRMFMMAMQEYKMLQAEYNEYNRRLGNRATYGVVNGRNVAAIVSWGCAMLITSMVVLSFLSGYRIF